MPFMKRLLLVFAFLASSGALQEGEFCVPMDLGERIRTEKAALTHTNLDMGIGPEVFDGKPETLIRTPSINPAFIQICLDEPVTVHQFDLIFSEDEHDVSIAAAGSPDEMASRSGSWQVLVEKFRVSQEGRASIILSKPVTARVFRLDVCRLTGDDHVHIAEWRFCRPGKLDRLVLKNVTEVASAVRPEQVENAPPRLVRPVNSVVRFLLEGVGEDGCTVDVTRRADWQIDGEVLEAFQNAWHIRLKRAGTGAVRAALGGKSVSIEVEATPRIIKNRMVDLDVLYVERVPRLPYDGSNEGWPGKGETVTWRAHVMNWGLEGLRAEYLWVLDGRQAARGEVELPPLEDIAVDWPWNWDPEPREVCFVCDPGNKCKELAPANNSVAFRTNGLAVGFWVEQSIWDHHHDHGFELGLGDHNSFADWAQRHMRRWNQMFAAARFPEAPEGVLDRVRLDKVVIVPDGSLPLSGGLPTNHPDRKDKTVDMMWGFPASALDTDWWSVDRALQMIKAGRAQDAAFYYDLALIHELGHARYLIDSYGFDVHAREGDEPLIDIRDEKGESILGTYLRDKGIVHWRKHGGQMGGDYSRYGLYEAVMLNRIAGRRARGGNYNSPAVIGEFLQEIPEKCHFIFVDSQCRPLEEAQVWVYQSSGKPNTWYGKYFDNEPDLKAVTDAKGKVTFNRTLFAKDGKIVHTYGWTNGIVILRIQYRGRLYFLFQEVTDLNLAFNLNRKEECTVVRRISLRDGPPQPLDPHNHD